MNVILFSAARLAGCTTREAEVLATYVESENARETARKLRLSEQTVKNHLSAVRQRFNAPHTIAVVVRLLS